MDRQFLIITFLAGLVFSSCQPDKKEAADVQKTVTGSNATTTDVPFKKAERYFVKNTVQKIDNPKIETNEQFDTIFGAAPVMGENGKPTAIDFSKQYVIALTLPETDFSVNIDPVSLIRNDKNEVVLTYKVLIGSKQTYLIKPVLVVVVDKSHDGKVVLVREA